MISWVPSSLSLAICRSFRPGRDGLQRPRESVQRIAPACRRLPGPMRTIRSIRRSMSESLTASDPDGRAAGGDEKVSTRQPFRTGVIPFRTRLMKEFSIVVTISPRVEVVLPRIPLADAVGSVIEEPRRNQHPLAHRRTDSVGVAHRLRSRRYRYSGMLRHVQEWFGAWEPRCSARAAVWPWVRPVRSDFPP